MIIDLPPYEYTDEASMQRGSRLQQQTMDPSHVL